MRNESQLKTIISFTICLALMWVLINITWGGAIGIFAGAKMGSDKAIMEEISGILKSKGIEETNIPKSDFDNWYKNLPPEIHKDIENAIKLKLQDINWFVIALAVSAFTFAIVGFLYGFINKRFFIVGLVVIPSFLTNNPVIRFPCTKNLDLLQKFIIVVAQFGVCYLFGYLGALLGMRRYNKRMIQRTSGIKSS